MNRSRPSGFISGSMITTRLWSSCVTWDPRRHQVIEHGQRGVGPFGFVAMNRVAQPGHRRQACPSAGLRLGLGETARVAQLGQPRLDFLQPGQVLGRGHDQECKGRPSWLRAYSTSRVRSGAAAVQALRHRSISAALAARWLAGKPSKVSSDGTVAR